MRVDHPVRWIASLLALAVVLLAGPAHAAAGAAVATGSAVAWFVSGALGLAYVVHERPSDSEQRVLIAPQSPQGASLRR